MDLGLRGKRVLLAGGSEGIAYAAAERFVAEGAHVALFARDPGKLDRAACRLREAAQAAGTRVHAVPLDITDRSALRDFIAGTVDAFGGIDICVANAGGPPARPFLRTTEDEWARAVDVTLLATVELCRAVLPGMQQAGWGRIVAITSVSTRQPVEDLIYSNTVRAGVLGFLKSLSNEYGPHGITVNNVAPGYTATARLQELVAARAAAQGVSEEVYLAQLTAGIPLRRAAQPGEVADAILFLASERAAYITGQTLLVDGGSYRGI